MGAGSTWKASKILGASPVKSSITEARRGRGHPTDTSPTPLASALSGLRGQTPQSCSPWTVTYATGTVPREQQIISKGAGRPGGRVPRRLWTVACRQPGRPATAAARTVTRRWGLSGRRQHPAPRPVSGNCSWSVKKPFHSSPPKPALKRSNS